MDFLRRLSLLHPAKFVKPSSVRCAKLNKKLDFVLLGSVAEEAILIGSLSWGLRLLGSERVASYFVTVVRLAAVVDSQETEFTSIVPARTRSFEG